MTTQIKHLSKQDIESLSQSLKRSFKYLTDQRTSDVLAKYIQFPKIPPILSESLVARLITNKKILSDLAVDKIVINHAQADLVIVTPSHKIMVEVKSTGKSAFQNIGEKDIRSDYLIWVHFNTFFTEEKLDSFEVFIIKHPKRYFTKPTKINLADVKKKIPNLYSYIFSFADL